MLVFISPLFPWKQLILNPDDCNTGIVLIENGGGPGTK